MKNGMDKMCVKWLLVLFWTITSTISTDPDPQEHTDRSGRSWHHALFGPQNILQHQQNSPVASTSQPSDSSTGHNQNQPDVAGSNRNFEDHDKAVPAASEQDYMSRQFGYLNVHRFDPNMPYYERNMFPRFPSPHAPRFGPGYRKDKYGHGYGYSCKQGDDCDEVRAANQLAARHPSPHPQHHNPPMMTPFNNHYPELPPFPSMPSFNPYGGHFGGQPARFNDPHGLPPPPPMMSAMVPSRFYHARYLHDQDENKDMDKKANEEVN